MIQHGIYHAFISSAALDFIFKMGEGAGAEVLWSRPKGCKSELLSGHKAGSNNIRFIGT